MLRLARAINDLTRMVLAHNSAQDRLARAISEVAAEQRVTNLIVRSQISTDPAEKKRVLDEAVRRMESDTSSSPTRRTPRH